MRLGFDVWCSFANRLESDYPFLRVGDAPSHWQVKLLFSAIQDSRRSSDRYRKDKNEGFIKLKFRNQQRELKQPGQSCTFLYYDVISRY